MDSSCIEEFFNNEDAILLAATCYQTYVLFENGKLVLPKDFMLRYTIRALAGVEAPTEEVFGFIGEPKDKIVITFKRAKIHFRTMSRIRIYYKHHIIPEI